MSYRHKESQIKTMKMSKADKARKLKAQLSQRTFAAPESSPYKHKGKMLHVHTHARQERPSSTSFLCPMQQIPSATLARTLCHYTHPAFP